VTQEEKTTITINQDGSVLLAGERLDLSQLEPRLKELGGKRPVTIRAYKNTDYRRIVEVMNACKAAAVTQIAATTH
jgi:biopolymer transport protein ExbD